MSCVRYSSGQNSLLGLSSLVSLSAIEVVVEIEAKDDSLDLKRALKIFRLLDVAVSVSLLPLSMLLLFLLPFSLLLLSRLSSYVCCGYPCKLCIKMMLLCVSYSYLH